MSDYKQKYLKYKNKYLELKKMSGGTLEEMYASKIQECDTKAAQNITDYTQCRNCPFNNAGANTLPNRCKPITGNANYCFTNANNNALNSRMNIERYHNGYSNITIENNIHVTPPEGEVCFGNTITSCLTYCVILADNTKISVHINPLTNADAIIYDSEAVIANETVNMVNVHKKILEILNLLNINIRKIIILTELNPYVCYLHNKSDVEDQTNQFIGTTDIFVENIISGYLDEEGYDKPIDKFLNEVWSHHMVPAPEIVIISGKQIDRGSIYMVDATGAGKIFDPQNKIESF
jgi:hypothetical protein